MGRRLSYLPAIVLGLFVALIASCRPPATTPPTTPTTSVTSTSPSPSPTTTAPPPTSTTPPPTTTNSAAAVTITNWQQNAVAIDADVMINVSVTGITLVDKAGQPNVPGEGHLVYYLDVTPPTAPGQPALTAPGTYAVSANASYTWPNVPDAVHRFYVQIVNNDNTPLNPPAIAEITLSVFTG